MPAPTTTCPNRCVRGTARPPAGAGAPDAGRAAGAAGGRRPHRRPRHARRHARGHRGGADRSRVRCTGVPRPPPRRSRNPHAAPRARLGRESPRARPTSSTSTSGTSAASSRSRSDGRSSAPFAGWAGRWTTAVRLPIRLRMTPGTSRCWRDHRGRGSLPGRADARRPRGRHGRPTRPGGRSGRARLPRRGEIRGARRLGNRLSGEGAASQVLTPTRRMVVSYGDRVGDGADARSG